MTIEITRRHVQYSTPIGQWAWPEHLKMVNLNKMYLHCCWENLKINPDKNHPSKAWMQNGNDACIM